MTRRRITGHDAVRLASKAIVNPRTIERAYDGDAIHDNTRARIIEAALALGLPLPPPEKT